MHIERDKSPVRAGARSRRAARSFRPALEGFERREMLAAGPLGMNLVGIEYVDAMKEAGAWVPVAGAPPLTRDANGWPMSDAAILVMDDRVNMSWDGPDPNAVAPDISGTYHLSFNGQATVSPSWVNNFTVQNQVYSAATNTTSADLVVTPGTPFLLLQFTNTRRVPNGPTDTGVTNVKLIRPGYAANTTHLFTTQFLDALEPFGTLRYMNVGGTNNYPSSTLNWSQRTLPTASSQVDGFGGTVGESWEYMIELANETNTDMWINIPGPATDDYVTQLASLIKNGDTVGGVTYPGLNPNLKVYIEYSNEVWGGIAATTSYNAQATAAEIQAGNSPLNNDGTTDSGTLAARRYLERTMQVTNIFRSVFGADLTYSKIRPVLGWQEGNWAFYTSTFPWFQSTFGAPSNYFYGMGNANYFGPSTYDSVNDIFTSLQASTASESSTTADFTTLATYYGLQNVAYEGGPALGADGTTSAGQNVLAALRDPRMEGIVEQAYLAWYAAGGDLANFYEGPYGIWGPQWPWTAAEASQAADPSLSPKCKGLMDVLAASPPAVTAGIAVSPTGPTAFSASTDSLSSTLTLGADDFSKPNTGQDGYWLLNVAKAGVYDLTLGTKGSGGVAPGVIEVFLDGQQVGGPISVTPGAGIDLGNLTLNAGLTTLLIHTVHGLNDPSQPSNPNYYQWQPDVLTLRPLDQAGQVLAIDAGDGAAGSFMADTDFSGGTTYSNTDPINTSGVTNPAPQAVYDSERYGNFTYTIPNLTAGANYTVRLHFAEIYWNSAGQRVFNVSINGTPVLSSFDIFSRGRRQGQSHRRAVHHNGEQLGPDRHPAHDGQG